MSHDPLYVPILKAKGGEFLAVRSLAPEVHRVIYPLFEIVPPPEDARKDVQKSLSVHLDDTAKQMVKSVGPFRPIMVDGHWIAGSSSIPHALDRIFAKLRESDAVPIPVTGASRDRNYATAVKSAVRADGKGLCFRLRPNDLLDSTVARRLLDEYEVAPSTVDLLLDFGEVTKHSLPAFIALAQASVSSIGASYPWRTLILASGAFPERLAEHVESDSVKALPRLDYQLWESILPRAPRQPVYADYAVNHPGLSIIDPVKSTPSGNIRYAGDGEWVIFRGHSVKLGWGQMRDLCQQAAGHPVYQGAGFSKGDWIINDCANGFGTTGNSKTWREVGTNHHITHVVRQLATRNGT